MTDFSRDPFPLIKVKTGRRSFNESAVRCLVQCLSETSTSPNEVCKLFRNVDNIAFGQCWRMANDDTGESVDDDGDDDDDSEDKEDENGQHEAKETSS